MIRKLAIISIIGLSGCGGISQDNVTACASALFAAGTSSPANLAVVALSTPACQALAQDVIQNLINDVSRKQHARGIRR